MNVMGRNVWSLFKLPTQGINLLGGDYQVQQMRGIRVKVRDWNLDRALAIIQRQMTSSGMERLIKAKQRFHLKNSEKRVLARKSLEHKVQSQDLSRKLQSILSKKIRFLNMKPIYNELQKMEEEQSLVEMFAKPALARYNAVNSSN